MAGVGGEKVLVLVASELVGDGGEDEVGLMVVMLRKEGAGTKDLQVEKWGQPEPAVL